MLSELTQESTSATRVASESVSYGAECDVVTITRRPAFFSATNERSKADIRSLADPWASSTSKQTPAKPASLIASMSSLPSTKPLSASGVNAASLLPPPNERYCAPLYIPDLSEKG